MFNKIGSAIKTMVIAYKNGLMISAQIVEETDKYTTLQPYDQKSQIKVDKSSETCKVFDSVYDAVAWIEGKGEDRL